MADFVVLNYTDKSSLGVQSSGTTGIEGLLECLSEDQAQYAYLRVTTGDEESRRTKFVLISWCGPGVKALARAKMSVKKIFRDYSVEMHATEKSELAEKTILDRVKKA